MDNLIITIGTSLIENYITNNPKKENITKNDILNYYVEQKIEDLRDRRFGSEVVAVENLVKKGIFSGKTLHMIIHDTVNGKLAGEVLEEFFIKKGIIKKVNKIVIEKLNKRNHSEFKTQGLKNLVEGIGDIVESVGSKYNVALCTVGGYTVEIFMAGLMAQILGIKSYFMFSEFQDVTEISPLPIKLDYNYYLENREFFNTILIEKKVKKSKLQKYLDEKLELQYFIEITEEDKIEYVEFSAIGEFYIRVVKDCKHLPRTISNVSVSDKEIPSSTITDIPEELRNIISELKASPYVNKLKIVFHNPNRTLKVSKFFILDSDDYESTLALEMKTSKGGYRVDIYTVANTRKEYEALMVYFNENFISI